jgi:hypothetical protein
VGPLLVGVISVGLVVGLLVGRATERARRGLKDLATARAQVTKGRKVAYADMGRAIGVVALVAVIFVAIFIGMLNSQR